MNEHTFKQRLRTMVVFSLFMTGCATMAGRSPVTADQVAQKFFDDVRNSKERDAYELFTQELSQRISLDQFEELIAAFESEWGKIESEETAVMPFHRRAGEPDAVLANVTPEEIRRYIYEVTFENSTVNCDLTLIPEGGRYKIAWMTFWGSNASMTPEIRDKIEGLFQ